MNILKWLGGLLVGIISITFLKINFISTNELSFNFNLVQAPTTELSVTTRIETSTTQATDTQTSKIKVNCENQSAYECERLTQMKALANLAEQNHVNVNRTSTAVNGQIVQDVIHTQTQAIITNTEILENTEDNYRIKAKVSE
jgi:hypothetical protein